MEIYKWEDGILMIYKEIGNEIGTLVDEKNAAYGSAFDKSGEVLKVLYPLGISPNQYTDVLATLRILDKLFRIASPTISDEGTEEAYKDIAGYGILGVKKERG